jgi:hypothetical protein
VNVTSNAVGMNTEVLPTTCAGVNSPLPFTTTVIGPLQIALICVAFLALIGSAVGGFRQHRPSLRVLLERLNSALPCGRAPVAQWIEQRLSQSSVNSVDGSSPSLASAGWACPTAREADGSVRETWSPSNYAEGITVHARARISEVARPGVSHSAPRFREPLLYPLSYGGSAAG